MIVKIPFSGFYESIHNSQLDHELWHSVFTDYATGCTNNDKLSNYAYDVIDWSELFIDYSQRYVEFFAHEFKLDIKFESLSSPREYNFITDRIFCTISDNELTRLYAETDKKVFAECIKETFTSYDGFRSFYSNDLNDWPIDPLEFDHNEAACLLAAWLKQYHDFDLSEFEWRFIENESCNGYFYELIYQYCKNERLFKIHDYLNTRAARV